MLKKNRENLSGFPLNLPHVQTFGERPRHRLLTKDMIAPLQGFDGKIGVMSDCSRVPDQLDLPFFIVEHLLRCSVDTHPLGSKPLLLFPILHRISNNNGYQLGSPTFLAILYSGEMGGGESADPD